jgi:predicted GH43/DUF377 family glycosyl hydrolase
MRATRSGINIKPDPNRVFFQQLRPSTEKRGIKIVGRIMALSEDEVDAQLNNVLHEFNDRHLHLSEFFLERFEQSRKYLFTDRSLSENRKLLIGAYFTQEYSLESAALFNPSMVWHPDQSKLRANSKRFIISLRATGEGHISSIVFRSGVINSHTKIAIDPISPLVTAPDIEPNPSYEKELFRRKLFELGIVDGFVDCVLAPLEESFTFSKLEAQVRTSLRVERQRGNDCQALAQGILSLAESNYEIQFTEGRRISERVIFPSAPTEVNGIEDARFVEFTDDNQLRTYYATYTAFDGRVVIPQLLETRDFLRFKISTLNGPEVHNKGLALFPRKINGLYAMLSRQDNENNYLMFSDNVHFWYTKQILLKPTYAWEFIQLGNCGSPIETEAGWLVLSHGVGPMRKYSIGAFLLDRDDPMRVIGRLKEPLLSPEENEREGYVPNVVYSCGGQIHGGQLIIPYAMADYASSFATVNLSELLDELLRNPA